MYVVTQTLITTGLYQIGLKRNNLLNNGKHLNDRIISLREVVWAHNTSIAPPRFIEMVVPSSESERYMCGRCRFCLFLRTVQTIWYFFYLHFTSSNK